MKMLGVDAVLFSFLKCLGLLATLTFSTLIYAAENRPSSIQILYLNNYQDNQQLMLDASIQFHFDKTVLTALQHEIPLTFNTEIELNEVHSLLGFNMHRNRVTIQYQSQLQYFGYSQLYVISNKRNKKVQSFNNLNDALHTLGTLSNFRITDLADLHPNTLYAIKMRVSLNKWQLPTPLIIDALWSSGWHLDSDWSNIQIQSPKSWL
ncbi:DUF4390 domain-containing protein [Hydrogenovibrio sp. 3SP14C1]|uniref:DUF4390 domain-containing protein n=1 Tax=Hydrogenovibrio sp. 3SP14C1 TaxID=3038774 RepID=UPI00241615AE|nr:DUF4390 domain-containing protein [Hydrogenovibrio sp. 3SP14C1]MDG4813237.1 DUF4390 domain-containing protein [Hydrogenovibrio sp. 3SP14C1]